MNKRDLTFEQFKERYDKLSESTKTRLAHALKDVTLTTEEQCWEILKISEVFDKLIALGVTK